MSTLAAIIVHGRIPRHIGTKRIKLQTETRIGITFWPNLTLVSVSNLGFNRAGHMSFLTGQDRTPGFACLKIQELKKKCQKKKLKKKKCFDSGVREGKRLVSGQSRICKFSGFPDWR